MATDEIAHVAIERYDLDFIHLWGDWSRCRVCYQPV